MLRGTGITPNMITVISIFVGAAVGFMFYHDNLTYNICGILLLVFANILDCVDGQLARLTGIKSAIGVSWTDSPGYLVRLDLYRIRSSPVSRLWYGLVLCLGGLIRSVSFSPSEYHGLL